jgi:hypothetical protein
MDRGGVLESFRDSGRDQSLGSPFSANGWVLFASCVLKLRRDVIPARTSVLHQDVKVAESVLDIRQRDKASWLCVQVKAGSSGGRGNNKWKCLQPFKCMQ